MELEPETIESIHGCGELSDAQTPPKSGRMWRCGCELSHGVRWRLCQYHEGFDGGAEAVRQSLEAQKVNETSFTPKCEWWRHDGCAHDPKEPGCTWPQCPPKDSPSGVVEVPQQPVPDEDAHGGDNDRDHNVHPAIAALSWRSSPIHRG